MNIEEIKRMMLEKIQNSTEPVLPEALNDERLEDAFKEPVYDENWYAPSMPVIWDSTRYGETTDGVKILSLKSARVASSLYSRYLDEEAIVWDAAKQELFLYIPDETCPTVAFKGGCWFCAMKPKFDYWMGLSIYDVYKEIQTKIREELDLKNE
jgi:hypothetical protein